MSIWKLLQDYIDETGATEASVLRRADLNKGTFTAWRARGVPTLPSQWQLVGLANALHRPYEEVLRAVLHDAKYLPDEVATAVATAQRATDLEYMGRIYAQVLKWLEAAGGDRTEARKVGLGEYRAGSDPEGIRLNALEVLAGTVELPDGMPLPWTSSLSDPGDTSGLALAADPGDDAAGESESYNEP